MSDFDKAVKHIATWAIYILPFTVLILASSMFFPFITGKNFFFRIVTGIAVGGWLILAVRHAEFRPSKTVLLWAVAAFVAIIGLANILGVDPSRSFWANFERMEGYVTILHLFGYFLAASSLLDTNAKWRRLFNISLAVATVSATWGFLQLFGKFTSIQSGTRVDGSFGNAAYMAIYMLFHVFIAGYMYITHEGAKWIKWLYAFLVGFFSFILLFTQTRGAILGLVGSVFLFALIVAVLGEKGSKRRKNAWRFISAILVLAALFFALRSTFIVQDVPPLKRLSSISLEERTTQSRFVLWGMAIDGFKERPVLGYGQENFMRVFENEYDPRMYNQEPWFDRAHNVFMDWLINGGILGLLAYLSMWGMALWLIWRKAGFSLTEKALFTSLLAGYFIHNLFVFDNIGSYLLFFTILAFVHQSAASKPEPPVEKVERRMPAWKIYAAPVVIALTIYGVYFFNVPGILAARNLLQALAPQPEGLMQNLEHYKEALSYDTYGDLEIKEQLLSATSQVFNLNVSDDIKQSFFELSINEMTKEVEENPESARANIFLGSFLVRMRQYNDALPLIERAIEISPGKQQFHFELVTLYQGTGETDKALEAARTAFELEPSNDTARIVYAAVLIRSGEVEEAERILQEKFGDDPVADQRLVNAYFAVGEMNKVIETWEAIIQKEPENLQHRISLAAAYLESGNRERAIEIIEEVIGLNPEFKEQGEFYIREIRAGRNP